MRCFPDHGQPRPSVHDTRRKVTSGMDVITRMESLGTPNGRPKTDVIIKDCGKL